MDATLPPDALLAGYPRPIRDAASTLREIVHSAVPDAMERVRPGWGLIGYDLPVGRRTVYFAYVAPEVEHIHLGFEVGVFMDDPDGLLEGAHLGLRKVRFLTFRPGDAIPWPPLLALIREAASVAAMSRDERFARLLDRESRPDRA